jgi:hypothetical protein
MHFVGNPTTSVGCNISRKGVCLGQSYSCNMIISKLLVKIPIKIKYCCYLKAKKGGLGEPVEPPLDLPLNHVLFSVFLPPPMCNSVAKKRTD